MARGSSPPPKEGRRRSWVPLLLILLVLSVLSMFFVPRAIDYLGFLLGYYPESIEGYICAVCGRLKCVQKRGPRVTAVTFGDSLATGHSERFVGPHSHIWILDWEHSRRFSGRQTGDSFAHSKIPIVAYDIPRALRMLAGTDYLEPVVKALCDVDNYYAYLARDVLCYFFNPEQPPTPEQLDKWWQHYKQFFVIDHDAERALPLLKSIEKGEGPYVPLQDAARQTLEYHDRFGVPTLGAVVSHGLEDN
jgi:hypothetical protein